MNPLFLGMFADMSSQRFERGLLECARHAECPLRDCKRITYQLVPRMCLENLRLPIRTAAACHGPSF
jgi:hypothetical protein